MTGLIHWFKRLLRKRGPVKGKWKQRGTIQVPRVSRMRGPGPKHLAVKRDPFTREQIRPDEAHHECPGCGAWVLPHNYEIYKGCKTPGCLHFFLKQEAVV